MLELDDYEDAERVADWVELELSRGDPSCSKARLSAVIRDASARDPSEAFLSDVWRHLRRRQERYKQPYFEIAGDRASRNGAAMDCRMEYEVCLTFSLYGASIADGSQPKLFERMSAEAIGRYIGGKVFVFGWPVLADVQADIAARVRQVSGLLNEKFVEAPAARYKDRGVDIIVWRPFEEPDHALRRAGQLVVLSQCAAGHHWREKTRELPIGSWLQYIHWATDPATAFSVACVINDDLWHDIAREVRGIVFDRIRLVNHLLPGVEHVDLRAELQAWLDDQIQEHQV